MLKITGPIIFLHPSRRDSYKLIRMPPIPKRVAAFIKQYPILGPLFWASGIQYFIVELAAARSADSYSFIHDSISNLGVTRCISAGDRLFCSPLHSRMDVSIVILGSSIIIGSLLFYWRHGVSMASKIAFLMMAVAGAGVVVVGMYPENDIFTVHLMASMVAFFTGAISIIIMALSVKMPRALRFVAIILAIISLAAQIMFFTNAFGWRYHGIVERATTDTQILWLVIFGTYSTVRELRRANA